MASPITFLLWSAAGKKNNTFALVTVAEDLLQNSCVGAYPHWSNSTWGSKGGEVKELTAMNGGGLVLSGGHSPSLHFWIVLLDPEPSRIFSVLCLGPGEINFYFL